MAVYDRWHKDPEDGSEPCRCGRGRNRLYPSADHGRGGRWQVRWRDPDSGKQRARVFAARDPAPGELPDPNRHAAAFDKVIQGAIARNDYSDPNAGSVTLAEYGEQWRKTRVHGESAARGLESRLRTHVYPQLGGLPMGLLARRPSLVAAWLAGLPLSDGSRLLVLGDVSGIFGAAVDDGIVGRDPTKSKTVARPPRGRSRALPFSPAEVAGIAACMPERFALVPFLGAGTGMRQMEMAALGAGDVVRGPKPRVRVTRQLKQVAGGLRWGPVKNRRPHDVPVPPALLELLDAHAARFPAPAVTLPWHEPGGRLHGTPVTVRPFLSRADGAPASRNAMDAAWRTGVARFLADGRRAPGRGRALARGWNVHRLRHTAASAWLRGGIDVVRVAAWLGYTVEVTTRTYLHLMPGDHDGEDAGRAASAAFLGACAAPVHDQAPGGASWLAASL